MRVGLFILLFGISAFWSSCKDPITQEELIQAALELKLEQWRKDEMLKCRQQALLEAEAYVDSILVVRSLPTKLDTIPKPPKPMKPPKPFFKTKPDSVVVDPIKKN